MSTGISGKQGSFKCRRPLNAVVKSTSKSNFYSTLRLRRAEEGEGHTTFSGGSFSSNFTAQLLIVGGIAPISSSTNSRLF